MSGPSRVRLTSGHGESEDFVLASTYDRDLALAAEATATLQARALELKRTHDIIAGELAVARAENKALQLHLKDLECQREEILLLKNVDFGTSEKCAKCATLETFILWMIERMKSLEDAR